MKYNRDICAVETDLCELLSVAFAHGDLGGGNYFSEPRVDKKERLAILQGSAEGFYNTEVSYGITQEIGGIFVSCEGVLDGVIRNADGSCLLDVIKNVGAYEFSMKPSADLVTRLKCYAFFLCARDGIESVRGRITYYNVKTKGLRHFNYRINADDGKKCYLELLEKNLPKIKNAMLDNEARLSAASAAFPYSELREGQETMVRECYSAIRRGRRIFCEAPTGTGKTMSSLYPAVRALGEGYIDKIFYLTAKASTRREAFSAAARLFENGVFVRTVVLTAKEQICPRGREGCNCDAIHCPYAKGYYDRVGGAIFELLAAHNGYPRNLILEMAKKHTVCPYELSLDLSEYCHIIICDYNYAFDPMVALRRYFVLPTEEERQSFAFLIDEAHNLADRARDMYSATVKRSELFALRDAFDTVDEEIRTLCEGAVMAQSRLRTLCLDGMTKDGEGRERGFYLSSELPDSLGRELARLKTKVDAWLRKNREHMRYGDINRLMSSIRKYLAVAECFDKGFLSYVSVCDGDITVKIYCLDPSPTMNMLLSRARSSVLFSATLTPTEYFCDVLGGGRNAESIVLPSPFDNGNLCVTVYDGVSVRSEDRKKNYSKYATIIAATVSPKHGNYIAYFPSYECLEGVLEIFKKKYPRVETVVQSRGMGMSEKEAFLNAFKNDEGHLRVGFCVLGGGFSEGVDLPGSRLIGSVIFGVGIPALSNERNIIMEYFDGTMGRGYDYAYTYLGMNRVLQAVGRVIRREGDRGVAVLVDDRYTSGKYRALYPLHWENIQYTGNAKSLAEIMRRFWEKG